VQGVSCVEAQLRNTTNAQILLDKVEFLPQPPFVAEPLSRNLQPEAKGAKACVAVDGVLQFVYRLTYPSEAAAKAQEITDIGRLAVQWRTAMGESGQMRSQNVVRKLLGHKEVEVTVSGLPSSFQLGKAFKATCVVHNHTNRTMVLQLQLRRDLMVGIFVCNLAFQNLGEVAARSSKTCSIELLPLVSGMHELKGFIVEDLNSSKRYPQEKLNLRIFIPAVTE
jgi:hypothetical protein